MKMKSIYNYTINDLENYFLNINEAKFRATQIFEWVYKKQISSFDEINNIKKELLEIIKKDFYLPRLEIVTCQEASDGTVKFLFRLSDGSLIETVLMRQYYGNSVCVTTQVGCNMGCAFCASGTTKKVRNLEAGEIVAQVLEIDRYLRKTDERVSHVVVMGIGEPFDNFDNLVSFLSIINHHRGLDIGARHITVSTCGIVPKIYEFAKLPWQVNLAISLHFPTNEKRSKFMKINQAYNIDKLMEAVKYYIKETNRRVTFEYIMLKNQNDSLEDADELAKILKGINGIINLIPYNETGGSLLRSSQDQMDKFYDRLKKYKLNVTLRKELGHDIDAACGQLRVKKIKEI